jgi:hypothetical protein
MEFEIGIEVKRDFTVGFIRKFKERTEKVKIETKFRCFGKYDQVH